MTQGGPFLVTTPRSHHGGKRHSQGVSSEAPYVAPPDDRSLDLLTRQQLGIRDDPGQGKQRSSASI